MSKLPLNIGLLTHVGASRRGPHFNSFLFGSKTGDFLYSAGLKLFQALKSTTICYGFVGTETITYGGLFSRFGFAAVLICENEVGIDGNISTSCKTKLLSNI